MRNFGVQAAYEGVLFSLEFLSLGTSIARFNSVAIQTIF